MAAVSKGAAGEVLAARFLRNRGYDILTANYRTRLGEIDIRGIPYRPLMSAAASGRLT